MRKIFCDICNKEIKQALIIYLAKDRLEYERYYEVCLECYQKTVDFLHSLKSYNDHICNQ